MPAELCPCTLHQPRNIALTASRCVLCFACVQARDPIPQLKRIMLEQGLATEDDIKAIHDK